MPRKSYKRKDSKSYIRRVCKSIVAKNLETKTSVVKFNLLQVGAAGVGPVSATFNDLNQGDAQNERIGNQVTMTSCKWDFFLTGTDATNSYRVIVYIPREPSVLIPSTFPFNGAVDYDQYTVLKDMYLTTSLNGPNCIRKNGYHSFRNRGKSLGMRTQWSSSIPNDQTKNKICIYFVTDSQVVPHPELNGTLRCFYKDA